MKNILLSLVVVTSACVTRGREFPSKFDWINKSKTKQDDVRLVLGEPQFVGSTEGQATWTYGYYKYSAFGPSYTKEMKFYWNPDRTVQTWSFNSSFPEDTRGVTKAPSKPISDVTR
jgi:hypothetical protein